MENDDDDWRNKRARHQPTKPKDVNLLWTNPTKRETYNRSSNKVSTRSKQRSIVVAIALLLHAADQVKTGERE